MKNVLIIIFFTTNLFSQNKNSDLLLETVGVLSAQGIYLTYASIGTIADGYVNKTYNSDFGFDMASELIILSQTAKEQLTLLLKSEILSSEDISFVAQLITGYGYLISQAEALIQIIKTDDKKYFNEFENYRLLAWDLISEMLGLE